MIVCMRTAEQETPIPASVVRYCDLCKESVWISQVLVPRVDSGEMGAICMACLPGVMSTVDVEAQLHPDQISELRDLGVLDYAQRFITRFNRNHGSK